ncbi:hypothetical protein ACFLWM_00370 [Chloroflexota bacterium]
MVAILGFIAALTYLVPYKRTHRRRAEIQEILADLQSLESQPNYREAVKLNVEFFRAIRCPFSYLWWLAFRAPKLRRNRTKLVELIDLPFPKWQKEVLETISWFEVWMRILVPIREQIIRELEGLKRTKQGPIVVASIGCGGMELERQVIYQLLRKRFNFPVIFIGVDYSPASFEVATAKFRNLTAKGLVQIKAVSRLGNAELSQLKTEAASRKLLLVFLKADAFALKKLAEGSLDLIYHTRLRHHLTLEEGKRLDKLAVHLAPRLVELDDLFSILGIIIISIFVWRFPAVLNGAVFSYLKDFSKKELLSKKERGWEVGLPRKLLSCYLRVYDKAGPASAKITSASS